MAERLSWTQPQCERCWIDGNGEWDLNADGYGVWQVLIAVRQPTIARNSGIQRCAFCGAMTIMGIFVRANPEQVRFPAKETVDE